MLNQAIEMREPVHQCKYRVLYGDTDSGGVVYYGNYLRLFEHGRTEFMRDQGVTYKGLEDTGLILPVVESYTRYKASAVYDDMLVIHSSLAEVKKASCRFNYKIYRENSDRILVKGFTLHAVVDRFGKLSKFPSDVFSALQKIIQNSE